VPDQKNAKNDFGIDQTPGVPKSGPSQDAVNVGVAASVVGFFDLSIFLIR
jgi:hypothetical protein